MRKPRRKEGAETTARHVRAGSKGNRTSPAHTDIGVASFRRAPAPYNKY